MSAHTAQGIVVLGFLLGVCVFLWLWESDRQKRRKD